MLLVEQIILVVLFLCLLAFSALSCGLLLSALIQIVCYGFDLLSQKYSEMVSKLNKGEDK